MDEFDLLSIKTPACTEHSSCAVCAGQYPTKEEIVGRATPLFWLQEPHLQPCYMSQVSPVEAEGICMGRIKRVNALRGVLQAVLNHHGDTLLFRWQNMTETQRRDLIKQVQPRCLSNYIRQRLEGYQTGPPIPGLVTPEHTRIFTLTPSINIDDLSSDYTQLLRLLFYRATFTPEDYVLLDNDQLTRFWFRGLYSETYVDGCFYMHGEKSGTWTKFDYDELHTRNSYSAPRAMLILESQESTMRTLWEISKKVLTPSATATGNPRFLELIQPQLSTTKTPMLDLRSSLSHIMPQKYDPDRILEEAESWRAAAENELRCFQAYPDYFYQHAKLTKHHPRFTPQQQLKYSVFHSFTWPVISSMMWSLLAQKVRTVCRLYHKHTLELAYGQAIPRIYEEALQALEQLLSLFQILCIQRMRKEHPELASSGRYDHKAEPAQKLFLENRFEWGLRTILSGTSNRLDFGLLLPELQLYIQEDQDHIRQMSALTQQLLSTMSTCHRISETLRCHAPMFPEPVPPCERTISDLGTISGLDPEISVWIDCQGCVCTLGYSLSDGTVPVDTEATKLLDHISALAPITGKKDVKWLQKEEKRHAALSRAWNDYMALYVVTHYRMMAQRDAEGASRTGIAKFMAEPTPIRLLLYDLVFELPSSYLSKFEAQREEILARHESHLEDERGSGPVLSEWAASSSKEDDMNAFRIHLPKIKPKTRKSPQESSSDEEGAQLNDLDAPAPPAQSNETFALPRKLFTVVRQIFPAADEQSGGTVAWQSFLNMMAEVGFAIETNGGSAFAFILKGHGRIVIHRPHPDSTLQSYHLRNIGTGLENRFGWQRENFVCA